MNLPAIVYGAGAFSNQYNTNDHIASLLPLRTVRLALRYMRRYSRCNRHSRLTLKVWDTRLRHVCLLWSL